MSNNNLTFTSANNFRILITFNIFFIALKIFCTGYCFEVCPNHKEN